MQLKPSLRKQGGNYPKSSIRLVHVLQHTKNVLISKDFQSHTLHCLGTVVSHMVLHAQVRLLPHLIQTIPKYTAAVPVTTFSGGLRHGWRKHAKATLVFTLIQ